MRKVKKPRFIKELGAVDINAIKKSIEKISEKTWNLENQRKENDFDCFHHTRHVIFRFIEGMRDHRVFYSNPIWSVWEPSLLPILDKVIKSFEFGKAEFPKVMLARLQAGASIDSHRDGAGSNLYTHKIHIPIQTNEKAKMIINNKRFKLEEGQAYEVNNLVSHAVENFGNEDRVHLIFEVFDNTNGKPE